MQWWATRSSVDSVAATNTGEAMMSKETKDAFRPPRRMGSHGAGRDLYRRTSRRVLLLVGIALVVVSCTNLHTAQTRRDASETPQVQASAAYAFPAYPSQHDRAFEAPLARQSGGFEDGNHRPVSMKSRVGTQYPGPTRTGARRTHPPLQLLAYETVLLDWVSPTPLRLEALDALSRMPNLRMNDLSPVTLTAIVMDTMHHSARLRVAARSFLVDHASVPVAQAFETVLAEVQADLQSEATIPPPLAQLTRTGLDMLFQHGMKQLDDHIHPTVAGQQQLEQAIATFRQAWELRSLAAPADAYLFPKALYGWGYALEDRAWIERDVHGKPHPHHVRAAQDKFRQFLTEARKHEPTQTYPHRDHLYHAESQLEQPSVRGAHKALVWKVLSLSGSFETGMPEPGNFGGLAGDFDGEGMSYGALQWNLGQGTVQPLLVEFNRQQPAVVQQTFGQQYPTLVNMLGKTRKQQLAWIKTIQNMQTFHIHEPWYSALKHLGAQYAFQKVQVEHAKARFQDALKLCETYQVYSERAVALMFDINVQNGGIGERTHAKIEKDFHALPATGTLAQAEVARLRIIANRVAESSEPRWVKDVRRRKLTIANGAGVVHGLSYHLVKRGITLRDYRTLKPLGTQLTTTPGANQAHLQHRS